MVIFNQQRENTRFSLPLTIIPTKIKNDYETFTREQKYIPELDVLQENRD